MNQKATPKWKKWFVPMVFVMLALGGLAHGARGCSSLTAGATTAEGSSAP